mmetsp:Transcript_33434/g.99812  ORF Transcript_33434/g.99812 Transcript_33434/m.99812 type:complete len:308 (+) Transcript_33434:276-1199(+)
MALPPVSTCSPAALGMRRLLHQHLLPDAAPRRGLGRGAVRLCAGGEEPRRRGQVEVAVLGHAARARPRIVPVLVAARGAVVVEHVRQLAQQRLGDPSRVKLDVEVGAKGVAALLSQPADKGFVVVLGVKPGGLLRPAPFRVVLAAGLLARHVSRRASLAEVDRAGGEEEADRPPVDRVVERVRAEQPQAGRVADALHQDGHAARRECIEEPARRHHVALRREAKRRLPHCARGGRRRLPEGDVPRGWLEPARSSRPWLGVGVGRSPAAQYLCLQRGGVPQVVDDMPHRAAHASVEAGEVAVEEVASA